MSPGVVNFAAVVLIVALVVVVFADVLSPTFNESATVGLTIGGIFGSLLTFGRTKNGKAQH